MARYFFDSSGVAKLYQSETGLAMVEAAFREPNQSIIISRLTVVEVNSVFARRVRMGDLSAADAASLRNHFLSDIATGVFTVVAVTDQPLRGAGLQGGREAGREWHAQAQLSRKLGLSAGGSHF